jgi:hypothetical protein
MKGASNRGHVALLGAGLVLSAVATFVATPSAAAVMAAGGAGALLAVPPLTSTTPAPRRPTVRVSVATPPTRRRLPTGTAGQPAGLVPRAVGVLRRVVGLALRTALAYLGLGKTSRDSKLVMTLPLR